MLLSCVVVIIIFYYYYIVVVDVAVVVDVVDVDFAITLYFIYLVTDVDVLISEKGE